MDLNQNTDGDTRLPSMFAFAAPTVNKTPDDQLDYKPKYIIHGHIQ